MRKLIILPLLLLASVALAAPAIKAPVTAKVGSLLTLEVSGSTNTRDFVTWVKKGAPEGSYNDYVYAHPGKLQLQLPGEAGAYELRLCAAASPYGTLARQALTIEGSPATVKSETSLKAGAQFEVTWTGPNNPRDYITIGNAESKYLDYKYTANGNPAKITAPEKPGEYEVRYILGRGDTIIATQKVTVGATAASLTAAPAQLAAGAKITLSWQGPGNPRDYLTIVKAGAAEETWGRYEYITRGNPITMIAPDAPGEYEARYLSAQNTTLARAKFTVGNVTGSITGPAQVAAGEAFKVAWKGPDNPRNFITVVTKTAREGEYSANWAYTTPQANPVNLLAPLQPGDYELRWSTGESYYTIARAALKVVPGKQELGKLAVTAAPGTRSGGAVELILDASGSMLQKLGATRRIDIAKQTLGKLTSSTIPAGTPFALRVFGREVDSCQTDLDVPLGPLNPAAVGPRISALTAKNGAKTPIGASLAKVADDLKTVKGEKLVVLITDGEETCGGDPAAEIEKLRKAGIGTRVSIVGFALDDQKLAATFKRWSDLGAGAFFDAKDAAGLDKALTDSLRPGFEVVNAQGQVIASGIVGGEAVSAPAGNHTVRIKGGAAAAGKPVMVKPKETASAVL